METHIIESHKMVATQANKLANAAYSMTLEEKRLLVLLASMVRKNDDHFKRYRFPAKDVITFLNLGKNNAAYDRLEKTVGKLLTRVIHIEEDTYKPNTPIKDRGWKKFQWLSSAEYIPSNKTDSGFAELELQAHSQMRPYLLDLKEHFSSIPFTKIAQLPSFYSVRIFEILWSRSQQLKYPKIYIELQELKAILGVEKKYSNFAHFKKYAIDKAQKDLTERTPISFTYEARKRGRKAIGIEFSVFANENNIQPELNFSHTLQVTELPPLAETPNQKAEHDKALERMVDIFSFKFQRANDLLGSYDLEHINRNLDYAEIKHKQGNIKNLTAYATKAIVQDYQSKEPTLVTPDTNAESLEDKYNQARSEFIDEIIEEFGFKELAEEFEPVLLSICEQQKFVKSQFKIIENKILRLKDNATVHSNFRQFIIDSYAPPYFESPELWEAKQKDKAA